MEIYMRSTQNWQDTPPTSEKEAFELANRGFEFGLFTIGSFSAQELAEIASYQVMVDYQTYLQYRAMSFDQKKDFLGRDTIELIYPHFTDRDLFFYLTREFHPDALFIDIYLKRNHKFRESCLEEQERLLYLYSSLFDYLVRVRRHPDE